MKFHIPSSVSSGIHLAILVLFVMDASPTAADDRNRLIQSVSMALDAGKIDDARSLLSQIPENDSPEYRYLQLRLTNAKPGSPAPEMIVQIPKPEDVEVRYAVLHPFRRLIVFICRDGGLRITDLSGKTSDFRIVPDSEGSAVFRGEFSGDGKKFFAGHQDGRVNIRNTDDWKLDMSITVEAGWPVRELAVSPDGTAFVAESKSGLELWRIADGKAQKVAKLGDRFNFGEGLSFSPRGDLIATGGMFDISVHDAANGETLRSITHASYTMGLEFSPDGRQIASAPRGNVNRFLAVFDADTQIQKFSAGPFPDYVAGMAFTPDGQRIIATGCGKHVHIFDAETGEVRLSISRDECSAEPAVLRDGSLLGWNEPSGFFYIDLTRSQD